MHEPSSHERCATVDRDVANLLGAFVHASAAAPPRVDDLAGSQLPLPYRDLLAHQSDMTPVLEAFYGQSLVLRVLRKTLEQDVLLREVLLVGERDQRVAEYGAIRINLGLFDTKSRELILACRVPLGTILSLSEIEHTSRPMAYFRIRRDAAIEKVLGPQTDEYLFGRRTLLCDAQQPILAADMPVLLLFTP